MSNHEITLLQEKVHEVGQNAEKILDYAKATFKKHGFADATRGITNMLEMADAAGQLVDTLVGNGLGDLMRAAMIKWLSEVQLEVCDEKLMRMN